MTREADLLIIGSGAAGLSAAVTAAHHGLRVIVAEKADVIGGTTAWSGGWIWAPRNPICLKSGTIDPEGAAETYLRAVLGNKYNPDLAGSFLKFAPKMVAFFHDHTELQFEPGSHIPDTYGHLAGAGSGGRSVIAAPYDGKRLGAQIARLRKPLRETSFMGMTIQAGADLRAFMTMTRDAKALFHVTRRFGRHLWDVLRYGRGMQLRNGNALVARLMVSANNLGVEFLIGHAATALIAQDQRIVGAELSGPDGQIQVRATRGVILATGGFAHDVPRRMELFPAAQSHRTLAVETATGDGIALGESVGGLQNRSLASPGAWCPVSEVPWPDGTIGVFPHIIERGKPGIIAVLANGRRFCNEGLGYHDYVTALLEATPSGATPESWLICTEAFQRRYGLGISRPAPLPLGPWVRNGYVKRAKTLGDLARICGIDAQGLTQTVERWNRFASVGDDPDYQRGTSAYMRLQGDASRGPNPCVAPIDTGPYLAVRVIPGSFGTFAGLQTDGYARVLGPDRQPISGLYAVGTDMASVMGGFYPAGGINLGPALTFGHVAGLHAAQKIEAQKE